MNPNINSFFDRATNTISYLVKDPNSDSCAIYDPVLNYDEARGRTCTKSADRIISAVRARNLTVEWIIETHVHADHLSAAEYIKSETNGKVAIGEHISKVNSVFEPMFNIVNADSKATSFDHLFKDEETYKIGMLDARAIHTPGHTPACMTHVVGDAAFVGDTLFMPDYGTARADFPGGDAATLYQSIQKIFALPPETRLFMCHDYKAPGRNMFCWESTVAEERAYNVHIHDGVTENEFVKFRNRRDAKLSVPRLILPSLQVNIRAGQLPVPENNGIRYLRIPLDTI